MRGAYVQRFPNHRFVWNRDERSLVVTAAVRGFDGQVNAAGADLMAALAAGSRPVASADASEFYKACVERGWLDSDLRLDGSFATAPSGPHLKRVQIELSLRCNLRCVYCYSRSGPANHIQLGASDVTALLDDAERLGVIWVDFTGGEFFLYRDWELVVAHARRLGLVVTIHTNGMALTAENVAALKAYGVRQVQVSVDSHVAAVHDAVRARAGAHEKALRGVKIAKNAGLAVQLCLMVHRHNRPHLEESVRWYRRHLAIPLLLDRIIPAGGEMEAQVGLSTQEYYEAIAPILRRGVSSTKVCENASVTASTRIEPSCGVAHSFAYVTAEGEIALCPTMTSRERRAFAGPRLTDTSLAEAWRDSTLFRRYRGLNCANAESCPAGPTCGGGCRSNAYLETGRIRSPDYLQCNLHKNATLSFVDFERRYKTGELGVVPPTTPD